MFRKKSFLSYFAFIVITTFFYNYAVVAAPNHSTPPKDEESIETQYDKYTELKKVTAKIPFKTQEKIDLVMILTKASTKENHVDYFLSLNEKYKNSSFYIGNQVIFHFDGNTKRYPLECTGIGKYTSLSVPYGCGHYIHLSKEEINMILNAKSIRYEIQGALYHQATPDSGLLREVTGAFGPYHFDIIKEFKKIS